MLKNWERKLIALEIHHTLLADVCLSRRRAANVFFAVAGRQQAIFPSLNLISLNSSISVFPIENREVGRSRKVEAVD